MNDSNPAATNVMRPAHVILHRLSALQEQGLEDAVAAEQQQQQQRVTAAPVQLPWLGPILQLALVPTQVCVLVGVGPQYQGHVLSCLTLLTNRAHFNHLQESALC